MDRLKDKVAMVTGGSNGIGKAISEMFAAEGAAVLITDIDVEGGETLAESIRSRGHRAKFHLADASSASDATGAVAVGLEWQGKIDILCNNAAYMGPFHAVLESTEHEWIRCIQVSLMGTHYFTRECLPSMIKQKRGSIVNIASVQAIAACMTSVSYTATKAALLGYTLSAAYDYGPHNVRVNSICPGPIQTRISPKPGEPHYKWQCEQTMLGRVGYPQELAYAALFLASDEASFITGITLPVDGGWAAK
jgi:NAD(P)-dependent dehydrogenase (short-subunit alcohol dehydrogenase family)